MSENPDMKGVFCIISDNNDSCVFVKLDPEDAGIRAMIDMNSTEGWDVSEEELEAIKNAPILKFKQYE